MSGSQNLALQLALLINDRMELLSKKKELREKIVNLLKGFSIASGKDKFIS